MSTPVELLGEGSYSRWFFGGQLAKAIKMQFDMHIDGSLAYGKFNDQPTRMCMLSILEDVREGMADES